MRTLALVTFASLAFLSSAALAQAPVDYQRLRWQDLRDLAKYETHYSYNLQKQVPGTALQGTANLLMRQMKSFPARFAGDTRGGGAPDARSHTNVRFYEEGARGPDIDSERTQQVFVAKTDYPQTRRDTIFSAEFEAITEEVFEKVYLLRMVLFIQDSSRGDLSLSNGYYFRRLWVRVNWNTPKDARFEATDPRSEYARVEILNEDVQDIPLHMTNFQLVGDILERKVILQDRTYSLVKTFPLGVGSFDIRTADGFDRKHVGVLTDEFPSGRIVKATGGPESSNTRSRNYPSYYSGRPFIGLLTAAGEYKLIGMHYQIDGELSRGFVSHGCIRVRDKDLYQLDAILNEGPHGSLPISFLNHQPNHTRYIHVMPKKDDNYKAVIYSTLPTEPKVYCPPNLDYNIRNYGAFHTVADGDCLTKVDWANQGTGAVIDYLRQRSSYAPETYLSDVEHDPTRMSRGETVVWDSDGGQTYQRRRVRTLSDLLQEQGGLAQSFGNFLECGFFCDQRVEVRHVPQRRQEEVIYLGPEEPYYENPMPPVDLGMPQAPVVEQRVTPVIQSPAPVVQQDEQHSDEWYLANEKYMEARGNRFQHCKGPDGTSPLGTPKSATFAQACASWAESQAQWLEYRDKQR